MDGLTYTEIDGVTLTPLRIIGGDKGQVLHGLKASENQFAGFGEAYFSTVLEDDVKGWKRHKVMISNLIVPSGEIRFVLFDDRPSSNTQGCFQEVLLSKNNYQRLTIPPGIWMAFQGVGENESMLLNISSIEHDPTECENLPIENNTIDYKF